MGFVISTAGIVSIGYQQKYFHVESLTSSSCWNILTSWTGIIIYLAKYRYLDILNWGDPRSYNSKTNKLWGYVPSIKISYKPQCNATIMCK